MWLEAITEVPHTMALVLLIYERCSSYAIYAAPSYLYEPITKRQVLSQRRMRHRLKQNVEGGPLHGRLHDESAVGPSADVVDAEVSGHPPRKHVIQKRLW